jgi:hypothetical protein
VPDILAGGLIYRCFLPRSPVLQSTIADITAAAVGVYPYRQMVPNLNWYKIFRLLLQPDGRLILADIDYLYSLSANIATGDQLL